MTDWTLGQCANFDASLDPDEPASLYCSERCKEYAKHVRYFRASYANGRSDDPEVKEALSIRLAHLVVGGYNAKERQVQRSLRIEVLAANGGMCCMCNAQPATEVDHIEGSQR